ncbi:MAG: hypothetical protein NTW14_14855 [bacterium]|nr:hypothetical protein [bacterium]
MKSAKINFREMIQDSQDYGSNEEHMISRVFFDLEVEGRIQRGLYADVKQPFGSKFEEYPLEVYTQPEYRKLMNYSAFRDAVEKYYRRLIGATGRGIRIEGGSNIRMRNNRFIQPQIIEFEIDDGEAGW